MASMALALTTISVYAQEQAKTDLGDDFVPGSRVNFSDQKAAIAFTATKTCG
jgi:hypothetical protein